MPQDEKYESHNAQDLPEEPPTYLIKTQKGSPSLPSFLRMKIASRSSS